MKNFTLNRPFYLTIRIQETRYFMCPFTRPFMCTISHIYDYSHIYTYIFTHNLIHTYEPKCDKTDSRYKTDSRGYNSSVLLHHWHFDICSFICDYIRMCIAISCSLATSASSTFVSCLVTGDCFKNVAMFLVAVAFVVLFSSLYCPSFFYLFFPGGWSLRSRAKHICIFVSSVSSLLIFAASV